MCIFCDIIEGKIPSKKVYEDDDVLAILDIAQTTKGHTLVMPKKHYDTYLDMPVDEFLKVQAKVKELTPMIVAKLNATGVNTLINTNPSAGQSVMHFHTHIIPRYDENDGITIAFKESGIDLDEVLAELQK